jgi:hypothetical protein
MSLQRTLNNNWRKKKVLLHGFEFNEYPLRYDDKRAG